MDHLSRSTSGSIGLAVERLFLSLGLGLMAALFTQSLKWTKKIAAAQPFARLPLLAAGPFAICCFSAWRPTPC